jgi:Rieske 2Fe-2S family protein
MYETAANKHAASPPQGTSLPQRFYAAEDIYQQEMAWLRRNMWLLVGHESEIPNAGDYFLYEIDRDSVIVIRDNDRQIRAHQNVCRHRGSRLCLKAVGSVRTITCPYHAWSYGLDGRLRAASFTPSDFEKTEYALISCHVRVHCGLIFLNFGETPPDFEAHIGLLSRELELQDVQHAKVAKRMLFSASANWKLAVENNLECYHCPPAHPTYCAAHPGTQLGRPEESIARYEQVRKTLGSSASEAARQFKPVYLGPDYPHLQYVDRQLIGENVMTESINGKPLAPLMGQNAYNGVQTLGVPDPLTSIAMNPDYVMIYTFMPRAVRRTDVQMICLVKATAREGVDYDPFKLVEVWQRTLEEDKTLIESVQLGIDSSAYRPGPYTRSETFVSDFNRWYLRRVAEERSV